jgi:hypothetical protein
MLPFKTMMLLHHAVAMTLDISSYTIEGGMYIDYSIIGYGVYFH